MILRIQLKTNLKRQVLWKLHKKTFKNTIHLFSFDFHNLSTLKRSTWEETLILLNLFTVRQQQFRWIISRVENYPGNKSKLVRLPFQRYVFNQIWHLYLKEKRV